MKVLYIGAYGVGTTSKSRGEVLCKIIKPDRFDVIDTETPFKTYSPVFKSLGWRFKIGPFISDINNYINCSIEKNYDIIWVDKGIFLKKGLIQRLRNSASIFIHYTPDTALVYNKSYLFNSTLPFYDYCITTKSFEIDLYREYGAKNVLYCTQGYNKELHRPKNNFETKEGICFVGFYERHRALAIQALLDSGFEVKLAGSDWDNFVKKNNGSLNLAYFGKGLFGDAYVDFLSGSLVGLGLLSKKFPELHTTRTIEIPACGTALATETNIEIEKIFDNNEIIAYNNLDQLIEKVKYYLINKNELKHITQLGYKRIVDGGYDYESILRDLLIQMKII